MLDIARQCLLSCLAEDWITAHRLQGWAALESVQFSGCWAEQTVQKASLRLSASLQLARHASHVLCRPWGRCLVRPISHFTFATYQMCCPTHRGALCNLQWLLPSGLHKTTGTAQLTWMSVQVLLRTQQRYSCVHVWVLHLGSLGRAQQCGEADGDHVPDAAVCGLNLPGARIPNNCQKSLLLAAVCQP